MNKATYNDLTLLVSFDPSSLSIFSWKTATWKKGTQSSHLKPRATKAHLSCNNPKARRLVQDVQNSDSVLLPKRSLTPIANFSSECPIG